MPNKAWKILERRVAAFFGGKRNPLSGSGSGETSSDVRHPNLYIEVKQRASLSVHELWDETRKLAKKEGKTPVVCLQKKNTKGFLVLVHCDDLEDILWRLPVKNLKAKTRPLTLDSSKGD